MSDDGTWAADDPRRIFVAGATWWEFESRKATMWRADRDKAEAEAMRRFPAVRAHLRPPDGQECEGCGIDNGPRFTSHLCVTCHAKSRAATALGTQEGWQPIESLTNMDTVLLWARGWRSPFVGKSLGDFGHCFIDGSPGFEMWGASHWMSLPAGPVSLPEGQKGE